MGGVSSWCDLLVNGLDEFDWQVLPIVAPARREPLVRRCRRTRARSGRIEVWSEALPRGRLRRATARRRELPAVLVRDLLGWEGDTDGACSTRASGAGGIPPACAARSARGAGWAAFLSGAAARCSTSAIPEAGTPPRAGPRRGGALYQTLYWVARTAAAPTPRVRRAARDRRGLVGDPGASSTRRCTARRWCSPSTASTCARPTSPPSAAATRPAPASPPRAWPAASTRSAYAGADVDLPGDRRQRLLGDGARHRPGEDPRALQRPATSPTTPTPPPGTQTVVSVGRIDPLKDIHTLLRVAAETLRLVPGRALPALRHRDRGRGGLRALVPGAARAARARRPLPLHGPHDRPQRRRPRRRRGADDEHLRGAADVDPGGDGPGPAGRLDRRRRRARTSSRAAAW